MILDPNNLPTEVIPGVTFEPDRTGDWEQRPIEFVRSFKLDEIGPKFRASVEKHGILTPLAVHLDTSTGETTLLNGHHRYFLAEELLLTVPLVWSVFPGTWRELRATEDGGDAFDEVLTASEAHELPGAYR